MDGLRNQLQIDIQAEAMPTRGGFGFKYRRASRGARERQPDFEEGYYTLTHELRQSDEARSSLGEARASAAQRKKGRVPKLPGPGEQGDSISVAASGGTGKAKKLPRYLQKVDDFGTRLYNTKPQSQSIRQRQRHMFNKQSHFMKDNQQQVSPEAALAPLCAVTSLRSTPLPLPCTKQQSTVATPGPRLQIAIPQVMCPAPLHDELADPVLRDLLLHPVPRLRVAAGLSRGGARGLGGQGHVF